MIRHLITLFLVTSFFWATNARAESHVTATATAKVVEDIAIVSRQPLDFGFIAPSATGGTVTVSPDNKRSETGGVQASLTFAPAAFSVRGIAGHSYAIHTPSSLTFFVKKQGEENASGNATGELAVRDFVTYSATAQTVATTGRLDDAGQDRIYLGATLVVPPNAAPGIYSGEVPLTVSY